MKRTLMVLIAAGFLGVGARARAADAAAKPDCTEKQKAVDDAKAAEKTAGKADLSSCKDMKGKEKKDCEAPLKEKAKTDGQAAKDTTKAAKTALDCCKKPDKKGCAQ